MKVLQYVYYRMCTAKGLKHALYPEATGQTAFWIVIFCYFRLLSMVYVLLTEGTPFEIPILYYCGDLFATLCGIIILCLLVLIVDYFLDFLSYIGWKKVNYLKKFKERWGNESKKQNKNRGYIIAFSNIIVFSTLFFVYLSADVNILVNMFKIPIIWTLQLFV